MKTVYQIRYNTFLQSVFGFFIVCACIFTCNLRADDSGWVILSILISGIQVYRQYKLTKVYKETFKEIKSYIQLSQEEKKRFKFSDPDFKFKEFINNSPNTMKYLFGYKTKF